MFYIGVAPMQHGNSADADIGAKYFYRFVFISRFRRYGVGLVWSPNIGNLRFHLTCI
jgi:hypothetical protein